MLRALQETVEFETSLTTRLEKAERRLEEFEGRNAHEEMEEGPVPQEREFNEGEAVVPPGAEAFLPDDDEEKPMEMSSIQDQGRSKFRFLPRRNLGLFTLTEILPHYYHLEPEDLFDFKSISCSPFHHLVKEAHTALYYYQFDSHNSLL
ncbi:hypothetical protein QQG55_37580 [Brugia pahangi]